jgi:hypothetical protein
MSISGLHNYHLGKLESKKKILERYKELEKDKEGWTWLINSKKWHYFRKSKSLCGKFLIIGNPQLEQGNNESSDNCAQCKKLLLKEE